MHILFLTQIIPYPPDAGPRVKTWHVLRYLAKAGHSVTLASFIRPEEEKYVPAVRAVCSAVHTVPIRRSKTADVGYWLRSHLSGRPFLIERDDLPAMRALVASLLAGQQVDVIHADQFSMTQFALPPGGARSKNGLAWPLTVFDAHNAVWTIVERMRQNARFYLRPPAALEARRVKRYEGMIVQNFDHTLAVAEPDRAALVQAVEAFSGRKPSSPPRITVVPIAVDTALQAPIERQPGSLNILTLGTLHYPPNADGIRWFIEEVYPKIQQRIPQVTLTIVGKNPPQDFLEAASRQPDSIRVTGYVPDLLPYYQQAALMVVPVRAGGGMRVRILEAFSRAIPVVTTTVGLEGIDARPGEEVLVADSPADFAAAALRLLQDPELQNRLGQQGRCLAERRYDWQAVLKRMEGLYREVKR
jgi:glycosyltransferase involved in cell wall biosynthesis